MHPTVFHVTPNGVSLPHDTICPSRTRRRRRDRRGHRRHRGRVRGHCAALRPRLRASRRSHPAARRTCRVRGPHQPAARLGRAALRAHHRLADHRPARHVLGHLPAHRRGPRPRSARQSRALPDPLRPVRHLRLGLSRDGPDRGPARAYRRAPLRRLVRPAGRAGAVRLRWLRADRVPARRRLAPPVRAGRDAVGADPPDADRRRLDEPRRPGDPARRGRPRRGARRQGPGDPPARAAVAVGAALGRGRLPADRPLDLPGRVRLRRPAVRHALPANADRAGREHRPRRRAAVGRARIGARRRRLLPRPARLRVADGRRRVRRDDADDPPLRRRGAAGGGRRARALHSAPSGPRRDGGRADRHGRPRRRMGLVARVDDPAVAGLAAARGARHHAVGRRRGRPARRAHRRRPSRRAPAAAAADPHRLPGRRPCGGRAAGLRAEHLRPERRERPRAAHRRARHRRRRPPGLGDGGDRPAGSRSRDALADDHRLAGRRPSRRQAAACGSRRLPEHPADPGPRRLEGDDPPAQRALAARGAALPARGSRDPREGGAGVAPLRARVRARQAGPPARGQARGARAHDRRLRHRAGDRGRVARRFIAWSLARLAGDREEPPAPWKRVQPQRSAWPASSVGSA